MIIKRDLQYYYSDSSSFGDNYFWCRFCKKFPQYSQLYNELEDKSVFKTHQDFYSFVGIDFMEIDIIPAKVMARILLVFCEYMFSLLGLQSDKNIDTGISEGILNICKKILVVLPDSKGAIVNLPEDAKIHSLNQNTQLGIARQLPKKICSYLESNYGEIIPIEMFSISVRPYIYIHLIYPTQEPPKLPSLRWTGKELVAIHCDNIQELAEKAGIDIDAEKLLLKEEKDEAFTFLNSGSSADDRQSKGLANNKDPGTCPASEEEVGHCRH